MSAITAETPLFTPSLIPTTVLSSLPQGYSIRPLQPRDYGLGFLSTLAVLTSVGKISETAFRERFQYMHSTAPGTYYLIVVLNGEGKVVGTGALVVERKFIHELGLVGHIEDIAVARDQQGKKLGLRIIECLDRVGESVGCYKVSGQLYVSIRYSFLLCRADVDLLYGIANRRVQTILDCSEANEGFYVKCGYKRAGLEMAHYYEKK